MANPDHLKVLQQGVDPWCLDCDSLTLLALNLIVIGLLVLNWSKLETDIDGAIWAFLDLDIDKGRVVTTKLNTDVKVELLRGLINTYCAGDLLDDMLQVIEFIGGYKEDRNFVVHGSWGTLMPENLPVCASIRPKAPPGEVISETFPKERMLAIINGILEAKQNLRTLMDLIEESRKRHVSESPEKIRNPPRYWW